MATKVRQIIPMAGPAGLYSTGLEWVAGDAEANNLAAAGIAEIVKTGLPDPEPSTAPAEATPEPAAVKRRRKRTNGAAKAAKIAAVTPEATAGAPAGAPAGEAAKGDGE